MFLSKIMLGVGGFLGNIRFWEGRVPRTDKVRRGRVPGQDNDKERGVFLGKITLKRGVCSWTSLH